MFNEWLLHNHPEFSEGLLNNRFTRAAALAGGLATGMMGGVNAARAADPTPVVNKIDFAKAPDKEAIEYTISVPASKQTANDMSNKIVSMLQSLDGQIKGKLLPEFKANGGTYRMLYTIDSNGNQISAKNLAKFLPKPDKDGNVTITVKTHVEYNLPNPKNGSLLVVKPSEAVGK